MANTLVKVFSNFSNGYVAEYVYLDENGDFPDNYCRSWLLLPAENLWPEALRGVLYIIAMLYIFIGVAIGSDVFMSSIEVITSRKRTLVIWDDETGGNVSKEVLVWNETVANLTLLALGSSAPEILLATVETINQITGGTPTAEEGLGFYTILGSAAFNLMVITAICIVSVPSPDIKSIRETGVFVLTAIWSLLAYVWLLAVLLWISPGVVEPWEAWLTLLFFPMLVMTAYAQDSNWWIKRVSPEPPSQEEHPAVAENGTALHYMNGNAGTAGGVLNGLRTPERSRKRNSTKSDVSEEEKDESRLSRGGEEPFQSSLTIEPTSKKILSPVRKVNSVTSSPRQYRPFARARFRHAAISSLGGGKRIAVKSVNAIEENEYEPRLLSVVSKLAGQHKIYSNKNAIKYSASATVSFAEPNYFVMENAGSIEMNVLLHRRSRPRENALVATTTQDGKYNETVVFGSMSIAYETREGTAKINEKFKYTAGTLVFNEDCYCQSITIPIINDEQFNPDTDFYIILKDPSGDLAVGDPSVARVTIVDDDKPGDFLFEFSQIFADMESGEVVAKVIRKNGSDGIVSVSYCTLDGTAVGGEDIDNDHVDYIRHNGSLQFIHNETSKLITVKVNKTLKATKNFVIVLSNATPGCNLGENSATVANLNMHPDVPYPQSRVLQEEEGTWGGQFRSAMTVGGEEEEFGEIVPPTNLDYVLHFITFPWKIFFSFVPPKTAWGGVPAFIISLLFIGVLTAVIEQLGHLIGCVVGLRTAVTGITIIALGTSLPDTFASRGAALHDDHADASIGNITGSNCVNVFLGLGLPWVIRSSWHLAQDTVFEVRTSSLDFAVMLFDVFGFMAVILLLLRRYFLGGELGGTKTTKYLSGGFLVLLWFTYIIVISLKAYNYF